MYCASAGIKNLYMQLAGMESFVINKFILVEAIVKCEL